MKCAKYKRNCTKDVANGITAGQELSVVIVVVLFGYATDPSIRGPIAHGFQ